MLNFIFLKESQVIENLNQKKCFKTVQKLAKRELGERWAHKRAICLSDEIKPTNHKHLQRASKAKQKRKQASKQAK